MNALALVRLLQLASPALPVGAYSYSQGLEFAVESGTVRNETTVLLWIGDLLEWNISRFESAWLARMLDAWKTRDIARLRALDGDFIASRETAELRAETLQMGYSLKRLLDELAEFPVGVRDELRAFDPASYPLVWSAAASVWQIAVPQALAAWLWAWCENQVMAALKAVPLGQAAGQRVLVALGERIPALVERSLTLPDEAIANFSPGFAIAGCRHETQYSRLFRS